MVASHLAPSTLFSLANRTILITGGGRGLGVALAHAVTAAGAHAACIDLHPEPCEKLPKNASYHVCNVTDEAGIKKVFADAYEAAKKRGETIGGIVAGAGIQNECPALEYKVEDYRKLIDINVTGVFLTAKYGAKLFLDQKIPGSIVNVASMSGVIANRGIKCNAYNTSKAAVCQMTRNLAGEWGPHGIRVNSLSPGYIRTEMTDMVLRKRPDVKKTWMAGAMLGRLGDVDDFAGPTVFLLSEASKWMTGADLRVDGGHTAWA